MPRDLLTVQEAAEHLRTTIGVLARMRRTKTGPSFIRVSDNVVLYRKTVIESWLESKTVRTNTKEV
jgi:hypothetical protein